MQSVFRKAEYLYHYPGINTVQYCTSVHLYIYVMYGMVIDT